MNCTRAIVVIAGPRSCAALVFTLILSVCGCTGKGSNDLGPRIEPWLRTMLTVLPDQVPADATWCRFTIQPDADELFMGGEDQKQVTLCGWLVGETSDAYKVIDWMGYPRVWNRESTRVQPDSLPAFCERISEIREQYNATEDVEKKRELKEQVGVAVFMMSSGSRWDGSLPEVLAAAWSLERGERATCAQLMIPLTKDVVDEQLLLDHFRDLLAVEVDQRMLRAFTGRDYSEALRLATLLAEPFFDGFRHQDRAKGLLATLPNRTDDFSALALVTPQDWQTVQGQYSREQQIEYLARRLRLIHAVQWDIPGGIDYSDVQHLPDNAVKGEKQQSEPWDSEERPEAINPYNELLRMNLTGAELLLLMPYLESPDYILAYDLYRFIPQSPYQLHKVAWVTAAIFNAVAQEELVDVAILEGESEENRKQHIDQIRKWCGDHATVTHADHLANTVKEAEEWQDVRRGFWGLLDLDEQRALESIVARCDSEPGHTADLARLLCLLDRKEYLARAREWMMQDRDAATQFWGALLVLKHSDHTAPEGLDLVLAQLAQEIEGKSILTKEDEVAFVPGDIMDAAVEPLIAIDAPPVRAFFAKYCGATPYGDFEPSSETQQRLFLAGYESALERLLYQLDDEQARGEKDKEPSSCNWLWSLCLWRKSEYPDYLHKMSTEQRAGVYADMKQWLTSQFTLVKDGKPSDIIKEDLALPWGEWRMYSSGWVRRL